MLRTGLLVAALLALTSPAFAAASPNDTVITTVGPVITDANGTTWGFNSAGQVVYNGQPNGGTSGVVELAYVNGVVWAENTQGNWYSYTSTGAYASGPAGSPLPATPPATPTGMTWNPGDLSTGITLSSNNMVATSTLTAGQGVRSTTSKSSGKACVQVVETVATNHAGVGVGMSSDPLTGYMGSGQTSVALFTEYSGQPIVFGNVGVASSTSVPNSGNGETVTIAIDATAGKVWFSDTAMVAAGLPWDDSATDNPATGVGGIAMTPMTAPYFVEVNTQDNGSVFTLVPTPTGCPTGFATWGTAAAVVGQPISVMLP